MNRNGRKTVVVTLAAATIATLLPTTTRSLSAEIVSDAVRYRLATSEPSVGFARVNLADGTVLYVGDDVAVRGVSRDGARSTRNGSPGRTTLIVDDRATASLAVAIQKTGTNQLAVFDGDQLVGTVVISGLNQNALTVSSLRPVTNSKRHQTHRRAGSAAALGAQFVLVPSQNKNVGSDGTISVDAYVKGANNVRTFQVGVDAFDGAGNALSLESVVMDTQRADYLFADHQAIDAADGHLGRLGAVLFSGVVSADETKFLGTFRFAVDGPATGSYRFSIRPKDSFLTDASGRDKAYRANDALVEIGRRPTDDAIR